jgi:hypothetical protein
MHASQAVGLGQKLDVIRDLVSAVQASIFTRLVGDFEEAVDLLLVETDATGELRESRVGVVACFVHHVDIKVVGLLVEEGLWEKLRLIQSLEFILMMVVSSAGG